MSKEWLYFQHSPGTSERSLKEELGIMGLVLRLLCSGKLLPSSVEWVMVGLTPRVPSCPENSWESQSLFLLLPLGHPPGHLLSGCYPSATSYTRPPHWFPGPCPVLSITSSIRLGLKDDLNFAIPKNAGRSWGRPSLTFWGFHCYIWKATPQWHSR